MDDLSSLDWSTSTPSQPAKPTITNAMNTLNFSATGQASYTSFRTSPSPLTSGRSTSQTTNNPPSFPAPLKKAAAAQDSFANLMSFTKAPAAKNPATLSLKERQELLEAEKRHKEEEKRKAVTSQFNFDQMVAARSGASSSFSVFSNTGSNSSAGASPVPPMSMSVRGPMTPVAAAAVAVQTTGTPVGKEFNNDEDLFAAFRASTKVDNDSHFPPPEDAPLDLSNPANWAGAGAATSIDDDPFGLTELAERGKGTVQTQKPAFSTQDDELDFLGDLGRPVEEVRREQEAKKAVEEEKRRKEEEEKRRRERPRERRREQQRDMAAEETPRSMGPTGNPAFDKAVEQLMAYGFDEEAARRGLTENGQGINVQAAANWLLDEAHQKAKEKVLGRSGSLQSRGQSASRRPQPERSSSHNDENPAWMGGSGGDDLQKTVAAVGGQLFKTANSLWKTGQKKVQKAMADFNQDASSAGGDPKQPKWMREAHIHSERKASPSTDEAAMLEGKRLGPTRSGSSSRQAAAPPVQPRLDALSRTGRLAKEDDDLSGYVSPNKRRGRQQLPASQPAVKPLDLESDLLGGGSAPAPTQRQQSLPSRPAPLPAVTRRPSPKSVPKVTRQIPALSPGALQTSTKHRLEGTVNFKRGDFAAAHASYSSSLQALPQTHPLAILLLTNRALTAIKTGEPKNAISDADAALALIGTGKGQDEVVGVLNDQGVEDNKDMKELFGKALARKAEALEHLERWSDAAAVWQSAVESGVGGATAAAGRQRCQKALAPKSAPKPRAPPKLKPRPSKPVAAGNSEAVSRLRAANEAAAREDDEKFALSEKVETRIAAWRDGKRENLRALLGSLDAVLWEGSGWKKVGLHELVMANKVKIAYMKAIARTHPDKIPQGASTEVKLIAGTVFATLNEAWDKFKAENGM